jgi:hypothetical protein
MQGAARFVHIYYLGTPLFLILDLFWKVNIRVAALEGRPGLRLGYYALCCGCAFVTWRRPEWEHLVGFLESSANLLLLAVSFFLSYFGLLNALSDGAMVVPRLTTLGLPNFLLAGTVWLVSYRRGFGLPISRS